MACRGSDPWIGPGRHRTDGDRLNTGHPANRVPAEIGFQSQWGDPVPERFIAHATA